MQLIMPTNTRQTSIACASAIVALLQTTACATPPSQWAGPEITGGTAEQRELLRDRVAKALGTANAGVIDRDLMVGICNGVRRDFSPKATCGLVTEKLSGQHYLVELPPQKPAKRRDAAAFTDPAGLAAKDLSMAGSLENRFGAAMLAATAVDVPLKDARPNVAGLDLDTVREATLLAKQLSDELPELVRGASRVEVRRHAATLLGWSTNPEASLAALEIAMTDPDEGVRNVASMNAAMLAPAASIGMQQRWSVLWCQEMASGNYTDRTKALLGLARLSRRGTHSVDESCALDVTSYANETAMPTLKVLAQIIAER